MRFSNFHTKLKLKFWAKLSIGFAIMSHVLISYSLADDKGIGPVKELKLESLNVDMATKGKQLFTAKCSACHKLPERYVGPALKDVTKRRTPEWIMNMILNPAEMLDQNDAAKELLGEFMVPMTFQNVTQDEARSILEYFRHFDEKGEITDSKSTPSTDKKVKAKK